jgi:hypothetical protein
MTRQQSGHQALSSAYSADAALAKQREIEQEASERGVSVLVVAQEWFEAEQESREANAARVNALINDPETLRQLRAQWAGASPPPAPEPEPRDPNAPPSAGRQISPPRR